MGSAEEFERLIEEHARLMSSAIRRVCGRKHSSLIPDVEQEVRLALWKRMRGREKIEHPVSYLYKVALTTALAMLRRRNRGEEEALEPEETPRAAIAPAAPEHGLAPPERSYLLEQVLTRLPQDQARALRAYLAGYNHQEVAELFGWTESTARHRIYRGLDALKKMGREAVHGR